MKKQLKLELEELKKIYFAKHSLFECFMARNYNLDCYLLLKYLKKYRYSKTILFKLFYYRKYSKFSKKLNVQINTDNDFFGFKFYHQNIIFNEKAIIGKNLLCYGDNCIGGSNGGVPVIGDNVILGYGAKVIGNVKIANNVIVGANALITKDILIEGCTVVGINQILK